MSFLKKYITSGATLSAVVLGMVACSEKPTEVGGGVTDIGNSIAGVVVDGSGAVVPSARVVAYYDSWNQEGVSDSVVTQADAQGKYTMKVKKNADIVLYASAGEECGLASAENVDQLDRKISIGKRTMYSSHIAGRNTGRMRVVGVSDSASVKLDGDGYFIFYNMPPGDVTLAYTDDADSVEMNARVEFTTVGSKQIYVLPELGFVYGDENWLAVQDLRYYVDEGYDGIQIHNPKSEHWTPITEIPSLPQGDSESSQIVTVAVPQNVGYMGGFLFPVKVDPRNFRSDVNLEHLAVINVDNGVQSPVEVDYWNDTEALLWVRVFDVDSNAAELNFKVFESEEHAKLFKITFAQDQYQLGALSRLHFNGDAKVLNSDKSVAKAVADSAGLLGKGVTLEPGQFMSIDSVDITYGQFTMSFWTKWNGPNGKRQVLASERGDSTYKIQWRYEDGKFSLMKGAPSSMEIFDLADSTVLPVGEWAHIALVSWMGGYLMYVNGMPVGEPVAFSSPIYLAMMAPVRIGGSGNGDDSWDGALDEFRIEMAPRSGDWIRAVYEVQKAAAE